MGWCGGTEIFDKMCDVVLDNSAIDVTEQFRVLRYLAETLENEDWDCQSDSNYYEHEIIQNVFKALHPDWFEEETEELQRERNHLAKLLYQMIKTGALEFAHDRIMFLERYESGYYK